MFQKKYRLLGISLLTAGHFFSDFYGTFLPALLPIFIQNLKLSLTASGILVMVHSITSSILQPLCGYFVDKSGYSWLILFGIPLSAVFICSSTLAPNYFILLIAVALGGLGVALFHPIGSSLVNRLTTRNNPGVAMSIFIGGGNFGFAFAPAVVTYWIIHLGTTSLPFLMLPGLLIVIGFYTMRLNRIDLIKKHAAPPSTSWYKSINLHKLNTVMSLRSWTQVAITTFLPIYLVQKGLSPESAGNMLTIFLTGGAAGGLLGGYIGDKVGCKNCILWALILSIPFTYIFLISEHTTALSWLLLALSGACLQGTMPSSILLAQDIIPDNKAMASGMMLGLACGLGGIGTAITGAMADILGLESALMYTIIPTLISIPLTYSIAVEQSQTLKHAA